MHLKLKEISFSMVLKWFFLPLLTACILINSYHLIIGSLYFRGHATGMAMVWFWFAFPVFSCVVLLIPFRILLSKKFLKVLGMTATAVLSHQMYTTAALIGMFLNLPNADIVFLIFCILGICGLVSFILHIRATKKKWLPVVLVIITVAVCFVIGSGNPQWSRIIYIYQVYYSPWKKDPSNLITNRREPRGTYPKYSEWDKYGQKTMEWSHPNDVLLRTDYYPDGAVKQKRFYASEQFVTCWYPNGQIEFDYNKTTRQKRSWNENGSVCEGEITKYSDDSKIIRSIQHFKGGLWHGIQRWYSHPSGALSKEIEYIEGCRHGAHREWYSDGILHKKYHYVDDLREGPAQCWNNKGELDWEKHYSKGVD